MEEKNHFKITLSTLILLGLIIIICIMGSIIYKMKIELNALSEKQIIENIYNENTVLENGIKDSKETEESEEDIIEDKLTDNEKDNKEGENINTDNVEYEISISEEIYATIKATKDGKIFSKKFEMGAMIDKVGTMDIKNIGKVALVSYSGGEACVVDIYQLINDEIKSIGSIDCGADMVNEASYSIEVKDERNAIIKAKRNSESIINEFEMNAMIDYTSVEDILDYGKVVFVAESGGEHYGIQIYRLSQDYITGKTEEIRNVGYIENNI